MSTINTKHFILFLIALLTSSINFAVSSSNAALARELAEFELECDILTVDLIDSPELEWEDTIVMTGENEARNPGGNRLEPLDRRVQPTWKISEASCSRWQESQIRMSRTD